MLRHRAEWLRVLRLYEAGEDDGARALVAAEEQHSLLDARVHARSRFRSLADPARCALYSVHDGGGAPIFPILGRSGEHTLVAVREFRRVPLDVSSLGLTVFTARPGRAVQVVAALAHFVERAVDLYQPGYLLLAHSLDEPRTCLLLTAVRDSLALQAAGPSAFSLDALVDELAPLLAGAPESYAYCPETESEAETEPFAVSPYAV
jgi:hypothetical protein